MTNLSKLFDADEKVRRWTAEHENTAARLELAIMHRNMNYLISQHEPVATLGLDRNMLEIALQFINHGDLGRLDRDLAKLEKGDKA
ncbi:MAG: hypothetical protein HKM02_07735 [Pseudomonadales bacterium]|nr:hypothetical protein [Pseudomonadales bacterium]